MAEKTPNPEKQAEGAKITTGDGGTRGAQGTAADVLPSPSQVDKGVEKAAENAQGQQVSR